MTTSDEGISRSIELAKAGFENAQERISAIDAKVGVLVGFLVFLLPAPLLVIGWLSSLEDPTAGKIFSGCVRCYFASAMVVLFLLLGMISAFVALIFGFQCLTPRGPSGYERCGPFHNDWRPNILFPIYSTAKASRFCGHLQLLQSGVDLSFVVLEYEHQLQQLGRILSEKFRIMRRSFQWMGTAMAFYGLAVLFAAWVLTNTVYQALPK